MARPKVLTIALWVMQPITPASVLGADPDPEDAGYAVGVVRFLRLVRNDKQHVTMGVLAENVHFSPVALLDDLLRMDVVVGYDLGFANEALVNVAVWPVPGLFVALGDKVHRVDVRFPTKATMEVSVDELSEPEARPVLQREQTVREHSTLIPAGAVGIVASRAAVLAVLEARSFDPLAELQMATGHPLVVDLADTPESWEIKRDLYGGKPMDTVGAADLWRTGHRWPVVDKVRADARALQALLHHGLFGGTNAVLRLPSIRKTYMDGCDPEGIEAFRVEDPTAVNRYAVPTPRWWDELVLRGERRRS